MPLINTTAITRRRRLAAWAAALVAAPLVLSASLTAIAHADPDPDPGPGPAPDPNSATAVPVADPKAQCESPEFGGLFVTNATTPDGVTHGVCQYIVEGYFYYDNYDNGAYTGTLVYKDGAKVPTERPQIPGLLNISDMPLIPFPGQF